MRKRKYSIVNIRYSIILIVCFLLAVSSNAQYQLRINYIDKDSSFKPQVLKLQTNFGNRSQCIDYINKIPSQLNSKGYISASVDSVWYDTTFARIKLYLGK